MENINDRFGWKQINEAGKKMHDLRKYSFKDNADLIIDLLKEIKEKAGKERIKVLDFGCAEGTYCLRKPKPFIEYEGYDNDTSNDAAKFHSLDEMEGTRFDAIVFSHLVEHLLLDDMISVMEWALDHGDFIIIMTPRSGYPFNEFWATIDHKKPYDNEMFLAYLDIIGWETINYYHVDWRSKSDPFLIGIPRFLFCVSMWISPFMGWLAIARNKKTTQKW